MVPSSPRVQEALPEGRPWVGVLGAAGFQDRASEVGALLPAALAFSPSQKGFSPEIFSFLVCLMSLKLGLPWWLSQKESACSV